MESKGIKERFLRWDSFAATVAIIVAIVLDLVVNLQIVAAFIIAVVVYIGMVIYRRRAGGEVGSSPGETAERQELAVETATQKIAGMRESASRVTRESTREIILRICDHSDAVLAIMADGKARRAAPLYLEQLVEPAEAMLDTYVRLSSRTLMAATELLSRNESTDFPMMERAARLFRERLQTDPGTDLKALEQILSFTVESSTAIVEPPRNRTR